MAGTKAGGTKAAATNKAKYGSAFYAMIGAKGGKKTGMKGFALNRELARALRISLRGQNPRLVDSNKIDALREKLLERGM